MAGADSESERPPGDEHESDGDDTGDTRGSDATEQTRSQETPRARGSGFIGGAILLFVSALALIIVTVQNTENVEFEFLWLDVSTPLVVVIMVAIAATVVIDEVVGFFWRRRRRIRRQEHAELRRLRKQR